MEPGLYHQTFYHDDGCKTLFTRNMEDCNCKVKIKLERSKGQTWSNDKLKEDAEQFKKIRQKYN